MSSETNRSEYLVGLMAAALIAPFVGNGAYAQDTSGAATDTADTDDDAEGGVIVVTGSRIANGNNSPTPVTIVSADDLLLMQPQSIAQGLSTLPGLLGSVGTTSNVNTGGYNIVNLRGIGLQRGLILFDGLRIGPTQGNTGSQAGATNIDVVPQMLLKRVDVVTGGASAVYGSDAVSGVVNFIPDISFEGVKLDLSQGFSTYGDDRKTKIAGAFGANFGEGRGHFEVGYEYRDNAGLARSSRDWFSPNYTVQGSVPGGSSPGSSGNPFVLTRGAVLANATFGGLITSGPLSGLRFARDGTLTPFVHGTLTGTSNVEVGGDGALYVNASLIPAQQFHQAFSRLDYELADGFNVHAQGTYTDLKQQITQQSQLLSNLLFGYNNPYLASLQSPYAAIVASQLAAAPAGTNPSFRLSEMNTTIPNSELLTHQKYWLADLGFDGSLGNSFNWSVDYYHTQAILQQTNPQNISNARLAAALNAVRDPASGNIVCNAALANPSVYGGCVPFNIFGEGAGSQAAVDYVLQESTSDQKYIQNAVTATITGEPFKLPAGPVSFALNGEWRRQSLGIVSNLLPTDAVNCVGIQFNCTSSTTPYLRGAALSLPTVSQSVVEGSIETVVPVLADRPFFEELIFNGAARFTHYNTSGSVFTWKLGGTWRLSDDIAFRITRSRDIRAPSLLDLFAPETLGLSQFVDLHTNTSGNLFRFSKGNADLVPEKADNFTAGVILTPVFLPGFSISADYYEIDVKGAITQIDPFQTTTQALCEASNGASPLCSLYIRPNPFSDRSPANYPTLLLNQSLNVAAVRTNGVDVEANYRTTLADRALILRALVNYQPKLTYDNGLGGVLEVAGAADGLPGIPPIAKWKLVASISYDLADNINLRIQERWRASLKQNASTLLVFATGDVGSVGYTDINLNFDVEERLNVALNVQNLFNATPPPFASSGGSTQMNYLGGYAQGDDIEGRYFTISARFRM